MLTNPIHERIWKHFLAFRLGFFHQNILPPFFYTESEDSGTVPGSITHVTMRWWLYFHSNAAILVPMKSWNKKNTERLCPWNVSKWLSTWKSILELHLRTSSSCKYRIITKVSRKPWSIASALWDENVTYKRCCGDRIEFHVRAYIFSLFISKMPEREDDHLTPATRLLEKRREMSEVEQALAAQKEACTLAVKQISLIKK